MKYNPSMVTIRIGEHEFKANEIEFEDGSKKGEAEKVVHDDIECLTMWADTYLEYVLWGRWLMQWGKPRIIYTNTIDERKER